LAGLLEDLLDQGSLMIVLDIQIEDALSRYTMPTSFWRLARHSLIPSTGSRLTTASPTPYDEREMVTSTPERVSVGPSQ
jgi:hypothetical protein